MHALLAELPLPPWLAGVLAIASVILFVGSLVAVPWLLVRLPPDFFLRRPPRRSIGKKLLRNLVGSALVLVGLALLVLPGQGILTVLLGLSVLDLPVKQRLLRRLLCQRRVRSAVQELRSRAHRPPLLIPGSDRPSDAYLTETA